MADITELTPTGSLNATENKFLINSAVTDAQSNSGPPSPSSTGLFDPQVTVAQAASNTESNEFNTTSTGGGVSGAVVDAQAASNTDPTGYTSPMYGTSGGGIVEDINFSPVTVSANRSGTQQTYSNPLHNYSNYTYSISLHLLTQAGFAEGPNYRADGVMGSVLIASAGRYDNSAAVNPYQYLHHSMVRNSSFLDDFYIEELKMTTVIGQTSRNRNSNAVDISFTIVEPNGFTLINRLLEANNNIGVKNYLTQPYLLQIDFFGYNDDGSPTGQILDHSKKIPIVLLEMKSRVTSKGTEYRVSAAPYNHRAFSETTARAPANFQIKANSLTSFFGQGGLTELDPAGRPTGSTASGSRPTSGIQTLTQQQASALLDKVALDKGYMNAINSWNEFLKASNNRSIADQFEVVFDSEILKEQGLVDKKRNPTTTVAGKSGTNKADAKPDWSTAYFSINSGTTIESVIEMAVRNSDYVLNQIKDPSTDSPHTLSAKIDKPLNWFKIVPKVELIAWDPLANDYAKKIVYYVKKWTVNNIHPNAPMGADKGAVKEYNYLYTGKNHDVLDLSIDFNMQYYVNLTVDRNKQQDVLNIARPDNNSAESFVAVGRAPTQNVVNPIRYGYLAQDPATSGQFGSSTTPNKQNAADVSRNLTGTSTGDMISVKLRILGDPHFIKQDDIFFNQNADAASSNFVNNSLVMDAGELYARVNFNSPVDYDERYGLATSYDQDSGSMRYGYNMFSGRYAIITVDNNFSKGKFEQTLDLVRLHNQPEDNLTNNAGLVPGQQFFRLPDFNQVQFPALQGFSSRGLPAGALLTGVLASGTGALSGIASTAISNGINAATRFISNEITGLVNSGISAIGDWWNAPSISWENIGTGGFENLAGGGATEGLINTGGISGLSDWGTVNTGQLIDSQVSSMASGLGGADLGSGGLDSLASGIDLGGIF